MKSPFPSILSVESPDGDSTANEPKNSGGEAASYSARYQAFLYQQSLRSQRANSQGGLDVLTSLLQGLVNVALFVAFFFGFLTLFGFGLSRLNGHSNLIQPKVSASAPNLAADAAKTPPAVVLHEKKVSDK